MWNLKVMVVVFVTTRSFDSFSPIYVHFFRVNVIVKVISTLFFGVKVMDVVVSAAMKGHVL